MSFLQTLQNSPVGQFINSANPLVGVLVQFIHIVGIVLLLTAVLLVALRLLGLGLRQQSVAEVAQLARPFLYWGLAAAVLSGGLMFVSTAVVYAAKTALQIKLVLLLVAVLLQSTLIRRLVRTPAGPAWSAGGAVASLVLWTGVGLAGRAIGFT